MEPDNSETRTLHMQVIDDDKNFNREALEKIVRQMGNVERNYYSVAIIGVQNSGKSTLLNHLFGTQFKVLKAMAGSRTTRGIWLSLDKSQNFIVLDVEGNDAMDRAQEQDYQKMVATYALVNAHVLIINIWCKSLGGYTGSQYQTLKVIMDICISNFKQQSPKTILFCVRDFNEEYDDEGEIKRKIQRDVNKLWRDIQKPEHIQDYAEKPEKFFTIQVCCLRRYREGKQQNFIEDVNSLRNRFVDNKADGYIFAKQKHDFNLPAADLPDLCEHSWSSILTNKKLNLPNEKDQLASFRCSTIVTEIQHQFEETMKKLDADGLVGNYGEIKADSLKKYDEKTYHYGKNISSEKRQSLVHQIDDQLKKVIADKLRIKEDELVKMFLQESNNLVSNENLPLQEQLKNLLNSQVESYILFMKHMNYEIPNRKQCIEDLNNKLKDKFQETKRALLDEAKTEFEDESSRKLRLLGSQVIKKFFGTNFWMDSKMDFYTANNQLLEGFSKRYTWITGESLSAVDYDNLEEKNESMFLEVVKSQLEKTLDTKVFDFFIENFRKEEETNDPISFNLKTEEQIAQHFDKTRDKAIALIKKLNQFNIQSRRSSFIQFTNEDTETFFESTWLSTTTEKIDKKMIDEYEKIIRRKKQGEMNQVPPWLYIVILYFLYDDIWFSSEQSPILYYTLLIFVLMCSIMVSIGQTKILKETMTIIMEKLKEKIPMLR